LTSSMGYLADDATVIAQGGRRVHIPAMLISCHVPRSSEVQRVIIAWDILKNVL
jgi:hypothetical protein